MTRAMFPAVMVVGCLCCQAAYAEEITLESAQPVVIKTVPEAGDAAVDASTSEIKVTFSKEMVDGNWSWVIVSKESFPETTGSPKYDANKRTCTLPVKLQPGKTYAIWLNSQKFQNFKDASGLSAVPYLLVFKTKP
jgi:hypothetical protein